MSRQAGSPPMGWYWLGLSLIILFVVAIRIRILNIPLERDEGEFAYVGQLMLDGVAPYKLAYVIKLPGTAAVYALCMALFGQTIAGIHLGLLLANVTAIVFVFLLARRWFGAAVGLISAGVYALMSLSWGVDGHAAHATQFVMPVALGGILLTLRGLESGRVSAFFWSGILFGVAFLLKQPGIFFGMFGGLLLLGDEFKPRPIQWNTCVAKTAIFCLGIILPFALLCLFMCYEGVFARFWYWSFTVAGGRWASWQDGKVYFLSYVKWLVATRQWPFWVLAGLSLPFVWWMDSVRKVRIQFLIFCAISMFAGCLGLLFIPHYFVLTLPAAGMLIGLGVMEFRRVLQNAKSLAAISALPAALFFILCACVIFADRLYLFQAGPDELCVRIYNSNLFLEAGPVADYIKKNSTPDTQIAVLGSEPEIYFYSHRRSATGHVSTYILFEGLPYCHQMQEQMIDEIESARPGYIVYVDHALSWSTTTPVADHLVLDVMPRYIKNNYELVGVAVIDRTRMHPSYYWEADAQGHAKDPAARIFVYKLQKPA